jgi:hypothetical protein
MHFRKWIEPFNPAIPKKWLLPLAGMMWSGVGIMLLSRAVGWLTRPLSTVNFFLGSLGVIISILANRFEFSKLAEKNIKRILSLNERACIFAFQAWKGYGMIAVMVTGGILLRNSAFPKPYLAVIYAAIGAALFQASLHYYLRFSQLVRAPGSPLE